MSMLLGLAAVLVVRYDSAFNGVWASKENNAYVIEKDRGTFIERDRFGFMAYDRKAPTGLHWFACSWSVDPFKFTNRVSRPSISTGESLMRPENPSASFWMKCEAVKGTRFFASTSGENGVETSRLMMDRVGSINDVWFSGRYVSDGLELNASFDSGANVKGRLTAVSDKFIFSGKFGVSSGKFKLYDAVNGREVGQIFIQWAPTNSFVAKMRDGQNGPTDRLLVMAITPRLDNGIRKLLDRAGD